VVMDAFLWFGGRYVLRILREIRPADLDQALMCLTFNDAVTLLSHLHHTLRKGIATELACKCVLFVTKLHHKQIVATGVLAAAFPSLQAFVHLRLQEHKDRIGVNLAALRYHERRMADDAARLPTQGVPAVVPKPIRVGKRKALALL
jgi:U3 small nucleolar RNA-associated protein 12